MQVGDIVITTSEFNKEYGIAGAYLGIVYSVNQETLVDTDGTRTQNRAAHVGVEFYDFMLPPSFDNVEWEMPADFVRKADLQDLKPFIV